MALGYLILRILLRGSFSRATSLPMHPTPQNLCKTGLPVTKPGTLDLTASRKFIEDSTLAKELIDLVKSHSQAKLPNREPSMIRTLHLQYVQSTECAETRLGWFWGISLQNQALDFRGNVWYAFLILWDEGRAVSAQAVLQVLLTSLRAIHFVWRQKNVHF